MIDRSNKVYFARCVDPDGRDMNAIKIGCSHRWNERVATQCSALPFSLRLEAIIPGARFMEAYVHLRLRPDRIRGEYFFASERMMKVVAHCVQHGDYPGRVHDEGCDLLGTTWTNRAVFDHLGVSPKEVAMLMAARSDAASLNLLANQHSFRACAAAAIIAENRGKHIRWPGLLIDALASFLPSQTAPSPEQAA